MKESAWETVLVTGASSGIGRQIAIQIASPGKLLWLVARDAESLAEVAEAVRKKGAETRVEPIDISDLDEAGRFLESELAAGRQRVDQLYLAAAVSLFGEVKDLEKDDWDRLYRVNFLSYAQWLQPIYAGMVARRSGTIVLFSSLAGYLGYPTSVPYASMKAGLVGLFRSLRHEADQYDVRVHLAVPGYVDTSIFAAATYRGTDYERTMRLINQMGFKMISAEAAAADILKGVKRGRREIFCPAYARLLGWLAPRAPLLVDALHKVMVQRFRRLAR